MVVQSFHDGLVEAIYLQLTQGTNMTAPANASMQLPPYEEHLPGSRAASISHGKVLSASVSHHSSRHHSSSATNQFSWLAFPAALTTGSLPDWVQHRSAYVRCHS